MSSHVVITGGSAGVGLATAYKFVGSGWRVTLLARDENRLGVAVDALQGGAGAALALPTDVADAQAVEAAARRAVDAHGAIDVWVNAAMATVFAPVAEIGPEEYRRVTEVTYLGQVYGTMSALRRMVPRNRGTIVNVSSALAYHGLPLQAAYCGAKFGVRGFTEALRGELLHDGSGVRVSLVVLPAVNTPQFDWARNKLPRQARPVPPVYQPEAAAAAIWRAAQTAPRELIVGGSSLQLLAGSIAAPGLIDRMLADRAYDGQQTAEPAQGGDGNLFAPVPGNFGVRGRFGSEAQRSVRKIEARAARGAAAALAGAVALGLAFAGYAIGRRRS